MRCVKCGQNNPATVTYCQKCGARLDHSPDEIRDAMLEKARGERARTREYYARQALYFSIIFFLIALTLVFMASGAPDDITSIPSAARGSRYIGLEYNVKDGLPVPKTLVPFKDRP